ncbi:MULTISPECIES: ABC transporter ATP-binding protein [unclassified Sporolactobacillus]|uniref:ABC transporter ATP-binding protein n=1 Tax=unclassified Sporolactobacillus TaxID=2628533 RepID=UPI0023686347|nr:ATP-binding cassette domain-containing protein [Sporolactobacillus sp. CQH2019]MDD9147119.1 ATP-binding cassette domain-containing protein [Sporolactobacillus sp. CQH2019]
MAQIEFQNVSYRHEKKSILKDISMNVEPGDYISIMGPSGSGKSTFLKLCCHLISPTGGRILFNNEDLMRQDPIQIREKISYCFQTPVLFGETVRDNLSFVYSIRKRAADWKRVDFLFSRFNMSRDYLNHKIEGLSGGEKQRIALIRTLLFRPDVLLLDEVTSALDADNTLIVERAIEALNQEGITILWVTHNPEQGKKYAGKLLTIEDGQIKSLEKLR